MKSAKWKVILEWGNAETGEISEIPNPSFGFRISDFRLFVVAFLLWLSFPGFVRAEDVPAPVPAGFKWRVILEPMSMHRQVTWEIPSAKRTVLAPVVVDGDDYLYPTKKILDQFGVDAAEIQKRAVKAAEADLASLKPRYQRDRKQVIQYAELRSDRPIVCSAVLAPKFLEMFKDTLGETVLLVVPNRFTAYVFPALRGTTGGTFQWPSPPIARPPGR